MVLKDEKGTIILENSSFYANDVFCTLLGRDMHMDFQRSSPRVTPDGKTKSFIVREHATIILNASQFKDFLIFNLKTITSLEKEFGKFGSEDFFQKFYEKQQSILSTKSSDISNEKPSYMG
ncbi:MAG: hypothetical protein AABX51_01950 [Nanoarchaeota archaeon]